MTVVEGMCLMMLIHLHWWNTSIAQFALKMTTSDAHKMNSSFVYTFCTYYTIISLPSLVLLHLPVAAFLF